MRVVITGAGGQLGQELVRMAPPGVEVLALRSTECDVGDAGSVSAVLGRLQPDVVINAAAYTAVDKAESEPDRAERVNAHGPRFLASAGGAFRLLHVSTDFVFDGVQGKPYLPGDAENPLSVYGKTKLLGEEPVLALGARGLVVRTSWVYSSVGSNFVRTMLRLMSTRPEVRVVSDQVAAPTWARGLAEALWRAVERPDVRGLHHWHDAGAASWYDFAMAILEEAQNEGLLSHEVAVVPIMSRDYASLAHRPSYSLLDCEATWQVLGMPPHWRVNLRHMLQELKKSNA